MLTASRIAGSPLEAWESMAVLLREHHGVLPPCLQPMRGDSAARGRRGN
jgi:hypothetical protein